MSESLTPTSTSTIFERLWQQEGGHLFKSEWHGVMAVADAFPKLPLQVVIAPRDGTPGTAAHFNDLPRLTRRKLHEVSDAIEEKMLFHCGDGQRVITHIEGFGVPDHAHIVKFVAERGHGQRLYAGSALGELAVQNTLELITFNAVEARLLEDRLDQIEASIRS